MRRPWPAIIVALAIFLFGGCAPKNPETTDLVVLAAASLKDVLLQGSLAFEAQDPSVKVELSFAGSQQLALQINQGAPCDVFVSADQKQIDTAEQSGRINPSNVIKLAENRLVIVTAENSTITDVHDLTKNGLKLVLAGSTVPAGAYTLKMLAKGGDSFKASVLKNVVSYEQDVRAVLTKVALGEADAGFVYATDIKAAKGVRSIELPSMLAITSTYYLAVLNGPRVEMSIKFAAFLRSPQGQKLFTDDGFVAPTK